MLNVIDGISAFRDVTFFRRSIQLAALILFRYRAQVLFKDFIEISDKVMDEDSSWYFFFVIELKNHFESENSLTYFRRPEIGGGWVLP